MSFDFPRMEVVVEGDEVVVRVFVGGFDEKDFEVEVNEDLLSVEVGKEFEKEDEDEGFFEREWRKSSFSGEVVLSCRVVPVMPRMSYDGEVLEVRMKRA